MSAPTNQPGFANALHEALRSAIAELRSDAATLAESIAAAPDDALPAIERALHERRQKANEPETKARLLRALAERPLSRVVALTNDETFTGCYSDAELDLLPENKQIRLSVRADVPATNVLAFLRQAAHSIESDDALRGRSWDRLYSASGDFDDELPF